MSAPPPSEFGDREPGRKLDATDDTLSHFSADALVRILDEYLSALQAGTAPSRDELLAQYPAAANQLKACLAGLDFIHGNDSAHEAREQLGDFRILKEVGRGGMGAVYEAQQVSLGRRVALKVLRFGTASDCEAIERFQREAETVATLHHTNIVPIFFVGNERGINFYAMQFIEGRNLAEVLRDHGFAIPPGQISAWALQAAEALAHAHQRGVIHRDVKPSNLILDQEGRLWLTDFGLARRTDDVTLSLTGMLLGTPRYMSPEQAKTSTKRIDHRSDLFSLGATLYELLTGIPAFSGDSAHDVIQCILVDEPVPIRKVNPAVPRDLETIVMKCLAKEPNSRYRTADELAADLRAQIDGRPIHARRRSQLELAARWVKQHRQSVTQISAAATLTLVVTLTAMLGWNGYAAWNRAGIQLSAVDPPLAAEFLHQDDGIVLTETLPMQTAASLPAGEYQLRVSGQGVLSQTFDLALERGRRDTSYTINLSDQWLLPPRQIESCFDMVNLGEEHGVVLWTANGLSLRRLRGPQVSEPLELSAATTAALKTFPGFIGPCKDYAAVASSGRRPSDFQPWVIREEIDVNHDGVGDLVFAARHQAWLMAVSGKGDEVLWFAGRGEELSQPVPRKQTYGLVQLRSAILHEPLVVDDLDGDSMNDFVVTMVDLGQQPRVQQNRYDGRRWIEAVSSKTGQAIWRHDLPAVLFEVPATQDIPYAMRWFATPEGGHSRLGGNAFRVGQQMVREPPLLQLTGPHIYMPDAPRLLDFADQPRLALMAGRSLVMLDPKTGRQLEDPIDIGARPGQPVRWADTDGDGMHELVTLEETANPPSPGWPEPRLIVWSYSRQKELWSLTLDAYWPRQRGWTIDAPNWPLVADLNADGKCEVIVPYGRSHNAGSFLGGNFSRETPRGDLVLLDGESAAVRWTTTLVTIDTLVDFFVDGPDIDGDGTRDLFVASLAGKSPDLHVDALSGATGKILWGAKQALRQEPNLLAGFQLAPPQWWRSGVDGWPQLLVNVVNEHAGLKRSTFYSYSAGTGTLTHRGDDIESVRPIDLDHDLIEDLVVLASSPSRATSQPGELHCVRGVGNQSWKRLATLGQPIADVDADGVRDLVQSWGDGTLIATSGATGLELWRSREIRATSELGIQSAGSSGPSAAHLHDGSTPHRSLLADFNQDGHEDLLVHEHHISNRSVAPLHAISGRSGLPLWEIQDVAIRAIGGTIALQTNDLDQDGTPEVIWLAAVDRQTSSLSNGGVRNNMQLWAFVVSGGSGKLEWSQPLSPVYAGAPGATLPMKFDIASIEVAIADLNADGTRDLIVPALAKDGLLETRALDGSQGKTLWTRARQPDGLGSQSLENWTGATFCDFAGDGIGAVVLVEPQVRPNSGSIPAVDVAITAVRADDGRELWTKPTGCLFTHFSSYTRKKGALLRPLVVRVADHQQRVAVMLPGDEPEIMTFDTQGHASQRKLDFVRELSSLFVCDANDDQLDELYFVDRGTIYATSPDQLDVAIWERRLGGVGHQQILEVLPGDGSRPPLIIAATEPTRNTVMGLHAANGKTVWTCPGPIGREGARGYYTVPDTIANLGARTGESPLIYFQYDSVGVCRQAVLNGDPPDEDDGLPANTRWTDVMFPGIHAEPAVTTGIANDSRWKRELPWHASFVEAQTVLPKILGWGLFFSLAMIICPGAYVFWLIKERRVSLAYFLLLPVVVALLVQALLMPVAADSSFSDVSGRFFLALACTPPTCSVLFLLRWLFQKNLRRLLRWLSAALVLSLLATWVGVQADQRITPLIENESYDWTGWYGILPPVAYAMSWIILAAVILEGLGRAAGRWWRRHRDASAGTSRIESSIRTS